MAQTVADENREHAGVRERRPDVLLDEPPVVPDAESRDDVDQPMESRPALSQPALRFGGGGDRQGGEQQQPEKSERDIRALGDVLPDRGELPVLIEKYIGREVQHGVEKHVEAQHPAQAQPRERARQLPERRHEKRRRQEPQCPGACGVLEVLDRIGPERHAGGAERSGREIECGGEACEENQRLHHPPNLPAQKFLLRSNPLYKLAT